MKVTPFYFVLPFATFWNDVPTSSESSRYACWKYKQTAKFSTQTRKKQFAERYARHSFKPKYWQLRCFKCSFAGHCCVERKTLKQDVKMDIAKFRKDFV